MPTLTATRPTASDIRPDHVIVVNGRLITVDYAQTVDHGLRHIAGREGTVCRSFWLDQDDTVTIL